MFHVERTLKPRITKGMSLLFCCFLIFGSCIATQPSMQIPDYILVPNGKQEVGTKPLTAFIFENNLTQLPIEQYLSAKYKTENYAQKEYWVTIDKNKYKLLIYDYNEFEKYFMSSNYSVINEVPESTKKGDSRKFIAISMINSYNEDCLAEHSLFQNIAVKYLKNLKDEFYKQ